MKDEWGEKEAISPRAIHYRNESESAIVALIEEA